MPQIGRLQETGTYSLTVLGARIPKPCSQYDRAPLKPAGESSLPLRFGGLPGFLTLLGVKRYLSKPLSPHGIAPLSSHHLPSGRIHVQVSPFYKDTVVLG